MGSLKFDFFGNISFYVIIAILFVIFILLLIIISKKQQKKNKNYQIDNNVNKNFNQNSEEKTVLQSEIKRLNYLLGEYKNKLKLNNGNNSESIINISQKDNIPEKIAVDKQLKELFEEKNTLEEDKRKFQHKNKKLWEQSIAIHKEKERINVLKQEIESRHKSVTDSIRYAQRIQTALMPSKEVLAKFLPNYFVMLKPKDIVSGDFYWAKKLII